MYTYPKTFMSPADLVTKLSSAGMTIASPTDAEEKIKELGYYRLKGYFFPFFDAASQQYHPGTNFSNIIQLYDFDIKLSRLIFDYLLKIEVTLRARLTDSLRVTNDALAFNDPSIFDDKSHYWSNASSVASEISRSGDEFIQHNYRTHDGAIPVWATVEVLSYGTLSKIIKNLKHDTGSPFSLLVSNYQFLNSQGAMSSPSQKQFSSWTQATSLLRNVCAHGGRIYNRNFSSRPEILQADAINSTSSICKVYPLILAMKYLRSTDSSWSQFVLDLKALLTEYSAYISMNYLQFPSDWEQHL